MNQAPAKKTDNILALTREILNELEAAQTPDKALEYCREIYRVAIQAYPGEDLIRAMEIRLPKPRAAPAEDISLSTNGGKLIITRPIGELNNHIIYAATTPGGVYFGSVKYSRGGVTAADFIPEWDIERPAARRAKPTQDPSQNQNQQTARGYCTTCASRTKYPDEAGEFHCMRNKITKTGEWTACSKVPAGRCKYTRASLNTIQRRLTGQPWHPAVVTAANRGLALPEDYYPYIAWIESSKGLELATQYACIFAELADAGAAMNDILQTADPKTVAAKIYPGQRSTIKRCLAASAINAIQAWSAERAQNAEEPAGAPIGNNQEGQKACP